MSGTWPSSPAFNAMPLRSESPTRTTVTHSLKRITRFSNSQRWSFSCTYPPLTRDEFAPIHAFALSQNGQSESFQIVLPKISVPRGAVSGSPLVVGAGAIGDTTISIDGLAVSTLVWKAGDVIKFAGHSKVYMVSADATTDGAGAVTVSLFPALIAAVADNEAVTYTSVPFTVSLASDANEAVLTVPELYGLQFDFVESF